MYAKYVALAGATRDQMFADWAAIICGATVESLSAGCDKTQTTISGTPTNWVRVDSGALGTVGQIISSLCEDGVTTKYAQIYANTSYQTMIKGVETWNSVSHTGTNGTSYVTHTTATTTEIFATNRSMFLVNGNGMIGLTEFTRDADYLKGTTYPSFTAVSNIGDYYGAGIAGTPRMKNLDALGDTINGALAVGQIGGRGLDNASAPAAFLRNADDSTYMEVRPIWAMHGAQQHLIGRLHDVVEVAKVGQAVGDTFVHSGSTYQFVSAGLFSVALNKI